jgi:trans-aconitate methyltransferase
MLYFPAKPCRVLELGCGNGDLYPYFRDRCSSYVGLDLSEAMIAKFASRWPDVELICGDASEIPGVDRGCDFVFSNTLAQSLDSNMLRRNLQRTHELLGAGGSCLLANIPDRHLRLFYYAGALRSDFGASVKRMLSKWFRTTVLNRDDGIGNWYSRCQIAALAANQGFSCRTYSSASYEYRFHALLRKP